MVGDISNQIKEKLIPEINNYLLGMVLGANLEPEKGKEIAIFVVRELSKVTNLENFISHTKTLEEKFPELKIPLRKFAREIKHQG